MGSRNLVQFVAILMRLITLSIVLIDGAHDVSLGHYCPHQNCSQSGGVLHADSQLIYIISHSFIKLVYFYMFLRRSKKNIFFPLRCYICLTLCNAMFIFFLRLSLLLSLLLFYMIDTLLWLYNSSFSIIYYSKYGLLSYQINLYLRVLQWDLKYYHTMFKVLICLVNVKKHSITIKDKVRILFYCRKPTSPPIITRNILTSPIASVIAQTKFPRLPSSLGDR